MHLLNWLKRMLYRTDHICPECQQVAVRFWETHCSFCDTGEGLLEGDTPLTMKDLRAMNAQARKEMI